MAKLNCKKIKNDNMFLIDNKYFCNEKKEQKQCHRTCYHNNNRKYFLEIKRKRKNMLTKNVYDSNTNLQNSFSDN